MNDSHPMNLNPSTLLIAPMFRVQGGRETHRVPISDQADTRSGAHVSVGEITTIIYDQQEYENAQAIVLQARHAVRKYATHTIIGYLVDKSLLSAMSSDIESIRNAGNWFNQRAHTCQVAISYLPIEISVALGPESARALADHVHDELVALRDALRAGEPSKARAVMLRTKNLNALAVGVQSDAIRFAIEEGRDALSKLKEAIKASESPESAGRHLDLGMIDSGIATFTYDTSESAGIDLSALEA